MTQEDGSDGLDSHDSDTACCSRHHVIVLDFGSAVLLQGRSGSQRQGVSQLMDEEVEELKYLLRDRSVRDMQCNLCR